MNRLKFTFFIPLLLILLSSSGQCQENIKNLLGRWSGINEEGVEETFIFNEDGEGEWMIGSGKHSGIFSIEYRVDLSSDPYHIEFSGFEAGPLKGMVLYGILEFKDDNSFFLDLEPGSPGVDPSGIRPDSFTEETVVYHREQPVRHIVLVWLKDPGNEEDRIKLIKTSYSFRGIPGVISVSAGTPLESERPMVDDSFDMAVVITFESRKAMEQYETHPTHTRAVEEVLRPLTDRMVIYDFVER